MEYLTLDMFSESEMTDCFNLAFSDYFQPVNLNVEKFRFMNQMRGVDYSLSYGAVEKGKLVGLILNAVRPWKGITTAYDCGTGIIPDYRSQGIGKSLFKICKLKLKKNNINQYLLEVIQANQKALNLYKKQGFRITREFDCLISKNPYNNRNIIESEDYVQNKEKLIEFPQIPENLGMIEFSEMKQTIDAFFISELKELWDINSSWQCSFDSIQEIIDSVSIYVGLSKETIVAYILYNKKSGEIYHLAVKNDWRKQKIAYHLLKIARYNTRHSPHNYILNVDLSYKPLIDFLKKNSFSSFETQFEMVLNF